MTSTPYIAPRPGDIDYDLEFYRPKGRDAALRPISVGAVRWDGATYYAVDSSLPWEEIKADSDQFVFNNVLSQLPQKPGGGLDLSHPDVKGRDQIRQELLAFAAPAVEHGLRLWAAAGGYDHVAIMGLVDGDKGLMGKPDGWPYHTDDLYQELGHAGLTWDDLPKQGSGEHNALADARHLRVQREWVAQRVS